LKFDYKKLRGLGKQLEENNEEKFSDKEALQLITQFESYEDELHGLKKKFSKDLLTVLSPKKVILLKKYEDEFNRKLLRQMREGKN